MHVLLVDDDRDLLELYTELLEQMGHHVTRALDGHEALMLAAGLLPDLIITDVRMPRMDGLELCERLRTNERLREVPLLIHSSETDLKVPPGEVFLPKSGDLTAFMALVDRLLSTSSGQAARCCPQRSEATGGGWSRRRIHFMPCIALKACRPSRSLRNSDRKDSAALGDPGG